MNLRRRTSFSSEDLNVLLAAGQGERAVFLPARTARQPVAESLVALANADGGTLVLGVAPRGTMQAGTDVKALRDLAARCRSADRSAVDPAQPADD